MAEKLIANKKYFEEVRDFLENVLTKSSGKDFLEDPPKKDQRGRLARKIDYFAVRGLFFFVVALVVSINSSVELALALAFCSTLLFHLVLRRSEKIRASRYEQDRKDYVAYNHVYSQVMKMNPDTEFRILVAQVLNGLDGFTKVRDAGSGDKSCIHLVGKFKDVPVGVCCNRYKKENQVGRSDLRQFSADLKKAGLTRGIFVSTSSFSEWAIEYVRSVKDEVRIVLVDKGNLLEWLRLSGHSIYPDEEQVKELERKQAEEAKMVSLRKREQRSKRLMQAFFLVCIYLTLLSLLMKNWLSGWLLNLYFAAAVVNMLLGFLSYLFLKRSKLQIKQVYALEQLD